MVYSYLKKRSLDYFQQVRARTTLRMCDGCLHEPYAQMSFAHVFD